MKVKKMNEHIEDSLSKKDELLQLLENYSYNMEVEGEPHMGIPEEDFEILADEIIKLFEPNSDSFDWEFRHFKK